MALGTAEILSVVLLEMVPEIVFASERSKASPTMSIVARKLVFRFGGNMDILIVSLKICWSLERGSF
jgi:hypothetical protein